MSAKIVIGADLVPTKSNYQYFRNGEANTLIGSELVEIINRSDFSIFNLEVPLTNMMDPITKCGPNLMAPTDVLPGIAAMNIDFFTLANNHILDHGSQGLESTIALLKKANIAYAGAGFNLKDASEPYTILINDIKIGIYCCAEHEFTIASENGAGANPFDPLESLDHISELKKIVDFVIVLYHGGKEHYRYPSPNLQKICRRIVDKGADLVVCQHSHCIGAEEQWREGTIVYGQGNFLFDYSESEYWQTSLLIEISLEKISDHLNYNLVYHPLVKYKNKVRIAEKSKADQILFEFKKRSSDILEPNRIHIEYSKLANSFLPRYFNGFCGSLSRNFIFRGLNKISGYRFGLWIQKYQYNKKSNIILNNMIECESHRELILQGLKNSYK